MPTATLFLAMVLRICRQQLHFRMTAAFFPRSICITIRLPCQCSLASDCSIGDYRSRKLHRATLFTGNTVSEASLEVYLNTLIFRSLTSDLCTRESLSIITLEPRST
ncbi:hypothetical protein EDB87DRAFT_1639093, partial [Lactarius vividus]